MRILRTLVFLLSFVCHIYADPAWTGPIEFGETVIDLAAEPNSVAICMSDGEVIRWGYLEPMRKPIDRVKSIAFSRGFLSYVTVDGRVVIDPSLTEFQDLNGTREVAKVFGARDGKVMGLIFSSGMATCLGSNGVKIELPAMGFERMESRDDFVFALAVDAQLYRIGAECNAIQENCKDFSTFPSGLKWEYCALTSEGTVVIADSQSIQPMSIAIPAVDDLKYERVFACQGGLYLQDAANNTMFLELGEKAEWVQMEGFQPGRIKQIRDSGYTLLLLSESGRVWSSGFDHAGKGVISPQRELAVEWMKTCSSEFAHGAFEPVGGVLCLRSDKRLVGFTPGGWASVGGQASYVPISDQRYINGDISPKIGIGVSLEGSLSVWGWKYHLDEFPSPPNEELLIPSDVSAKGPFQAVAAGDRFFAAINGDSDVLIWGGATKENGFILPHTKKGKRVIARGNLGIVIAPDGAAEVFGLGPPRPVQPLVKVADASIGDGHYLVRTDSGKVFAWGNNKVGQCDVAGNLSTSVDVFAGAGISIVVTSDGRIQSWGRRFNLPPEAYPKFKQVVICDQIACGLTYDGVVMSWFAFTGSGPFSVPVGLQGKPSRFANE